LPRPTSAAVSREARRAAELLATRFLQPDRYEDRKAPSFWEILTEPRFFTDVLDALDTITGIGLGKENSGVRTAEAYLRSRQATDGLWYPGPPVKGEVPTVAVCGQGGGQGQGRGGRHLADPAGPGGSPSDQLTSRMTAELRHDFRVEEVRAIHDRPLPELLFRAQEVHRQHHRPDEVQLCALLSVKTGACQEDCAYCAQSTRYSTGCNRVGC
jgi:hypothetical protein